MKLKQNKFETVLFQFHFIRGIVSSLYLLSNEFSRNLPRRINARKKTPPILTEFIAAVDFLLQNERVKLTDSITYGTNNL